MKAKKEGEKRLQKRKVKLQWVFQHINSLLGPTPSLDSLSSLSEMSMDTESDDFSAAESAGPLDEWDNLFGTDWHGNHFISASASEDANLRLDLDESLPDLGPAEGNTVPIDDVDDRYSGTGSLASAILDVEADDEMSNSANSDSVNNIFITDKWSRLCKWVCTELAKMYANQYELPRDGLP